MKKTVLKLCLKVSDRFDAHLVRLDGENSRDVGEVYSDYVPAWMPGEHWGDYVILEINVATGKILNWKKPTAAELNATFKVTA